MGRPEPNTSRQEDPEWAQVLISCPWIGVSDVLASRRQSLVHARDLKCSSKTSLNKRVIQFGLLNIKNVLGTQDIRESL